MASPISSATTTPSTSGQPVDQTNRPSSSAQKVAGFSPNILRPQPNIAAKVTPHSATTTKINSHSRKNTEDWINRKDLFDQLEKALLPKKSLSSDTPLTVRVLHGKGGMGKSELALWFANEQKKRFSFVWLLDYSSESRLKGQYAQWAESLGLPVSKKEESIEEPRSRINLRLENWDGPPWLLVLDNVEKKIHPYDLPPRGGAILITSQDNTVWDGTEENLISVDSFTLEEAVTLIKKVTGEEESEEMKDLAKKWGLFPFAIHQVARYIRESKMTIQEYRNSYRDPLQGEISPQQKYQKAFQTVWTPALDKLKKECPLAIEWLELSAYLHPRSIPEELLEEWLKNEKQIEGVEIKRTTITIRINLLKLALASFDPKTKTFDMHRLFQDVLRTRGPMTAKIDAIIKALTNLWQLDPNKNDFLKPKIMDSFLRLFPHLENIKPYIYQEKERLPDRTAIFNKKSIHLWHQIPALNQSSQLP